MFRASVASAVLSGMDPSGVDSDEVTWGSTLSVGLVATEGQSWRQ